MRRSANILAFLIACAAAQAALPVRTTFTGAKGERTWPLSELGAGLPSDWSDANFLVLEFKASSSQRFDLGLETAQGRISKRIGPFAGVWVRAAIPLRFYREPPGSAVDLAATFNQPRNSYWINIGGKIGPTKDVRGLTVTMDHPVAQPTLEIRSVALAKDDPGDAVLEGTPLVDELGQYTHAEWPGKAHTLGELKSAWAAEAAELAAATPQGCPYGGFSGTSAKATGFFRVEQVDGRWWFVCPDGHLFFSSGVNGVGVFSGTRVQGREALFAKLPPQTLFPGAPGRGGRGGGGSFYTWNVQRRFGDDWRAPWSAFTAQRLRAWGFNSIHYWGPRSAETDAEPRIPYAQMLRGWMGAEAIMGMPDVYAADFERRVDEAAATQLEPRKDDPLMLGYFIGNEPSWPGRETQLAERLLAGPATELQKRLRAHLAEGDTPERRKAFVYAAFARYIEVINAACRRHAPHHLNLGIRFGGSPPADEIVAALRGCDVFSINIYRPAPSRETLDRIYERVQRPLLIGEFHIGASERGLAAGLVQAMNQEERGVAYRYYVEQAAAHPALIGAHWFQWLDQPVTGRSDGENYNIGFVDVTDQPYAALVAAAKLTHARLLDVHRGATPPVSRQARDSEAAPATALKPPAASTADGKLAPKPLYRDPVYDGAADPVVIWNPHTKTWWMFYTNRRANAPGLSGVAWVHGTAVGIAESADAGATWRHLGTAEIDLPPDVRGGGQLPTYWAPEVITGTDGTHHMFLTVVPGVFEDWQHPRSIVHLTSADLRKWNYGSTLKLAADRVIDACVSAVPGGGWRLWYNNERDGKSIYYADSRDLKTWSDRGKVTSIAARGEGPYVFTWRGRHWMLVDTWRGLGVYRSLDLQRWEHQPALLLDRPGRGTDDGVNGGHPCVVVSGTRAFCFYFTHPGRAGTIAPQDKDSLDLRRSSIHVVEFFEKDGWLTCDRDAPTYIRLDPPGTRASAASSTSAAAADRDPAAAAKLRALGSRDIRAHDPSTLIACDGDHWLFHTGRGVPSWHSRDLRNWTAGPPVFEQAPSWVAEAVPENRNASFWAPDVIKVGDRYLLYYSVSAFGKRTSAIALATNATLNPAKPAFHWQDQGIVVRTSVTEDFNAIDPAVMQDNDGRLWMTFGSFWSGIKLVELDPATGMRRADAPLHAIAHNRSIEAAYLHRHGEYYYLFVNHGWCCRGVNSTYHIRVGRSKAITGPYLDREGQSMMNGGGTLVAPTDGPFIGAGHASIMSIAGREWFGCHFYDATQAGRPGYALRPLTWDDEGWPVVGTIAPEN